MRITEEAMAVQLVQTPVGSDSETVKNSSADGSVIA